MTRIVALAATLLLASGSAPTPSWMRVAPARRHRKSATAGSGQIDTVDAAFCTEADAGNFGPATAQCEARGFGYHLTCVPNIPGPTCFDQLADLGIACPVAAAPVASPSGLVASLLLLSGIAAVALRRR
ncbi:MAG: hypothetical protein U0802_02335 [Candidatus Binatia bacterium]